MTEDALISKLKEQLEQKRIVYDKKMKKQKKILLILFAVESLAVATIAIQSALTSTIFGCTALFIAYNEIKKY